MMETRRLILVVALSFALILLYMQGVAWMDKHHPGWAGEPPATQPVEPTASAPSPVETPANPATQTATSAPSSTTAPTMSATNPTGSARVVAATQAAGGAGDVSLGSGKYKDDEFSLALTLEPKGAGIKSVVLNQFKA